MCGDVCGGRLRAWFLRGMGGGPVVALGAVRMQGSLGVWDRFCGNLESPRQKEASVEVRITDFKILKTYFLKILDEGFKRMERFEGKIRN